MTLTSVIASKWVPNLISQAHYKLFEKSVSSSYTVGQMGNQSKFDVSLQPPRSTLLSLKFFMIHKIYGSLCVILKELNFVFVPVKICSIADNVINTSNWRKRNSYCNVLIRKCLFIENLRIKFLSFFQHQISITVMLLSCGSFSTSNQSFEWMEYLQYCSISMQNLNIQLKVYFVRAWHMQT